MRICAIFLILAMMAGCSNMSDTSATRQENPGDFSSMRVDFGIVVSDIDKAAEFYGKGLGLAEVKGFDVPADLAGDSGLSDYKPFSVRVFKVADDPNATQVKLMQFPDVSGKPVDNTFISTTLGVSYLTVYVSDITASVERAKKCGASPLAKGPVALPGDLARGIYLALVRDPDGNIIELVGPKK